MVVVSFGEDIAKKIVAGFCGECTPIRSAIVAERPGVGDIPAGTMVWLYGHLDGNPRKALGVWEAKARAEKIVVSENEVSIEGAKLSRPRQKKIAARCGFDSIDDLRRYYHVSASKPLRGLLINW